MKISHYLLPIIVAGLMVTCGETIIDSQTPNDIEDEIGTVTLDLSIKDDDGVDTLVFQSGSPIHVKYSVVNSSIDTVLFWRIMDQDGLIPTCDVSLKEYDGVDFDIMGPGPSLTGIFLLVPDSSWNYETIFINTIPGDYELDVDMNFGCCVEEPEAEMVINVDWDAKISVVD